MRRIRLTLFAAIAGLSCEAQHVIEPSSLRDVPMVLAIRVEVVAEGPHSQDLFPVPADRVRAEPLPGDTIRPRALVVDETGELDPAHFDPQWLLCSRLGSCRPDEDTTDCSTSLPSDSPCLLGRGASPQLVVPDLEPARDLVAQAGLQLVFVGSIPGKTTTDECMEKLRQRPLPRLDGCVRAHADMWIGPLGTLAGLLGLGGDLDALPSEQPNYHPEVSEAFRVSRRGDFAPEYPASRHGRTEVPGGTILSVGAVHDERDAQPIAYPVQFEYERVFEDYEELQDALWVSPPASIGANYLFVPSSGEFFVVAVVNDGRGGVGWWVYDFVVDDGA